MVDQQVRLVAGQSPCLFIGIRRFLKALHPGISACQQHPAFQVIGLFAQALCKFGDHFFNVVCRCRSIIGARLLRRSGFNFLQQIPATKLLVKRYRQQRNEWYEQGHCPAPAASVLFGCCITLVQFIQQFTFQVMACCGVGCLVEFSRIQVGLQFCQLLLDDGGIELVAIDCGTLPVAQQRRYSEYQRE